MVSTRLMLRKKESDSDVTVEEAQAEENSGFGGFSLFSDGAAADNELPQFEFLDKLKVEVCFCLHCLA